jgi:hypothetical protein
VEIKVHGTETQGRLMVIQIAIILLTHLLLGTDLQQTKSLRMAPEVNIFVFSFSHSLSSVHVDRSV